MKSSSETRHRKTKTQQLEIRGRLEHPVWVDPGDETSVLTLPRAWRISVVENVKSAKIKSEAVAI